MRETHYYVGAAVNATQYRSAAVMTQRHVVASKPHYRVRAIRHWPARTNYTDIATDLEKQFAAPPLSGATLVADVTTSGLPVYQMLRQQQLQAQLRGLMLTGGQVEVLKPEGVYNVSKQILISTVEIVIGQRRIEFAEALAETETILKTMARYTTRPAPSASELYSWRDSDVDELILALAAALWAGERHDRWQPRIELLELGNFAEPDTASHDADAVKQWARERGYFETQREREFFLQPATPADEEAHRQLEETRRRLSQPRDLRDVIRDSFPDLLNNQPPIEDGWAGWRGE